MSEFEKWLDTNGFDESWHNFHNSCDYAKEAFKAGMLAAAEIAESHGYSLWPGIGLAEEIKAKAEEL